MRQRRLLIAILAAALAGVGALSVASRGHSIEIGFPFSVALTLLIFGSAVVGNRLAFGVAFVVSCLGAGFIGAVALFDASADRALALVACALWSVAALALWGLKPADEPASSASETGERTRP